MSMNCIKCVKEKRTGLDLLCDNCRCQEQLGFVTKRNEQLWEGIVAAKEFMDYLRANTGFTDEWPIELKVAPDTVNHVNQLLNKFEQKVYFAFDSSIGFASSSKTT